MFNDLAKILMICGVGLIAMGAFLWMGFPFGKLPGDIHIRGERTHIYIPIATSLLISVILTLILNFMFWLMRR